MNKQEENLSGKQELEVNEEHAKLGSIMEKLSFAGLLFLLVSFFLYAFGVFPSFVSPDEVASSWHLPIREYIQKTHIPTGWDWLYLMSYADMISYASIAFLALISIISFIFILPSYIKKRDMFGIIVLLEIIILLLAASGLVTG